MRFDVGSKVIDIMTNEECVISEAAMYTDGSYRYHVKTERMPYGKWVDEDRLGFRLEFSRNFEQSFLGLLIDVNLKTRNFDIVSELHQEKQKL